MTKRRIMRMMKNSVENCPVIISTPIAPRRRRVMKSIVLKVMMLETHLGRGALLSYLRYNARV